MDRALLIGLGNPGDKYQNTRHNIGFKVVDSFLKKNNLDSLKNKFNGQYTVFSILNQTIFVLKPQTYMNNSGICVVQFCNYFKLSLEDLIVVHDDLDIEFNRLKIKKGGSSAGHKGIASIIEHTGSADFIRIRMGIGHSPSLDSKSYVLTDFNKSEKEQLQSFIKTAIYAIDDIVKYGITKAMNQYNRKQNNNQTENY